ncbi:Golgi membrane protein 1-like isoform X1 [Pseudomyrmex gracilis]|uniref:Golgi membrane protein 1-like isoform X1 n=1 Tax=Pseudomyrmex gracilis TaxID=219809 RepID=UPI000994C47A|nr:Golgi membrane protein 1-like isoform X1 [Pseudomyrmex gracilis]XP_020280265.1 Golgi membrane protein 1-like isoform X1 [Pseudomyrmex gracilis]XP_020280266.1 Golgi membrane protein 1-like isoform X1 [Pseudomyrmex gracilis]XP_020280267.1 Golgi membrane protein 1-like isoform X1 [Pseudomyrmex gracilis]XP_020280268.1 Golgi membrane protein 1-like isoform X1 [Pseudomyrmex gracilis]
MGIDGMRVGGGRCPPLLVGGLLLACLWLTCNWWTLSSENLDLVRQIDDLNEQLKISAEERDQCVTLRGNLEQRYKHTEDELASLHVRLDQQIDLKKKNEELEDSVTVCKGELDSLTKVDATRSVTLETLRLEKDTLTTQLNVKRDENKKLQEDIEKLKGEVEELKLSCNSPPDKKETPNLRPPTTGITNKSQLHPVPESAVRINVAGQRGLRYHGIPILPTDPPGAVRLPPRFSVTMLKKVETGTKQINDTSNDAAEQGIPDAEGLEDPDNRARVDNNGDEIQSTDETMLLPENYEEEGKMQDATNKPEYKNNNVI